MKKHFFVQNMRRGEKRMKKYILLILSVLLVFTLISCGGNVNTDTETETETETEIGKETDSATDTESDTDTETDENDNTDSNKPSESDTETETETEKEDVPITPGTPTVEETLKEELKVFDEKDVFGNEGNVLDYTTRYDVDIKKEATNERFEITAPGTYRLHGTSNDGGIYIHDVAGAVTLVFDGVSLRSKNNYPAIFAEDCDALTIVLKDGTENYLYDTASNNGEKAALRVRSCNLTIKGKGTLNIEANSKYGISNTKELTIESGNINITSLEHAIFGQRGINIKGGKFTLNTQKSGLKSGDESDKDGAILGYVKISAGSLNMTCATNGINCYGLVEINSGRVSIKAKSGNAIDASDQVKISGGTLIFDSYKSSIATDANVIVSGNANLKLITCGNGISANDVEVSTSGVIYIKTSAVYEPQTDETKDDTKFVLMNGKYEKFDATKHPLNAEFYVRRNCRGFNAKNVTISNGIIGINSYEDSFNVNSKADPKMNNLKISGGRIVISTTGEAADAEFIEISGTTKLNVLKSERGLYANYVSVSGGEVFIAADKDAIALSPLTATEFDNTNENKINLVEISGGILYLFEKIDIDVEDTVANKVTVIGDVSVTGGTILIVSTNNKSQITVGTSDYISGTVTNKDKAYHGAWLRVTSGDDEVLVQLPKDYTDKMAIYYSSPTMGDSLNVEIGTKSSDKFTATVTETIE